MNIVNGNILNVKSGIIVHQVNCMGVMGAGLAKQIKDKYPNVYYDYKDYCKTYDNILGDVYASRVDDKLMIIHLFGQYSYGRNKKQTDYDAFEKALIMLKQIDDGKNTFYFPYGIGCGLAGGDWNVISSLIDRYFPKAIIVKYN
ncbi:MAG: macro domain-containing protein [Cetobacterium sp.]